MGLETRTKFVCGVVSLKDTDSNRIASRLLEYFGSEDYSEYAFILHDKDYNENGVRKTPHFHFVATLKKPSRLATTLNRLAKFIDVDPFAVSISKYTSLGGCLQYLIHKKNPEKYSYSIDDIRSNIDKDDLLSLMEDDNSWDFDSLYSLIISSPDRIAVIKSLGLNRYRMYRSTINDIYDVLKGRKL